MKNKNYFYLSIIDVAAMMAIICVIAHLACFTLMA